MKLGREDHRLAVVESITFRSTLEARWATFFSIFRLKWEYEPYSFRLRDGHTYTPDFRVEEFGFVEIKPTVGHLRESARRIKQFLSEHPEKVLYAFCGSSPRFRHGEIVLFKKNKIYLPNEAQINIKLSEARNKTLKIESAAIYHEGIAKAIETANLTRMDHMVSVRDHFVYDTDRIIPFDKMMKRAREAKPAKKKERVAT